MDNNVSWTNKRWSFIWIESIKKNKKIKSLKEWKKREWVAWKNKDDKKKETREKIKRQEESWDSLIRRRRRRRESL